MRTRMGQSVVGAMACAALVGALLLTGCENAPEASAAILSVTPERAEIGPRDILQFVVSGSTNASGQADGPYLPLEWSVSDVAVGRIISVVGLTATYEAADVRGNNTVTVRDQADREGSALIVQQ